MRLAAVVPSDALYIDANFKETQIASIQPGQTVGIHVDALGDKKIEGKVLSISPASGAVFSLLPAENATGNFTKITQRLPVRIAIPKDALATHRLMAGLSVGSMSIRVRRLPPQRQRLRITTPGRFARKRLYAQTFHPFVLPDRGQ